MNKKIILVGGDPNSINSEIIFKCWKKLDKRLKNRTYLISNFSLLKSQFKLLKYKIKLKKVKNISNVSPSNELKIIDVFLKFKDPFNVSLKDSSKFIRKSLNLAHKLGLKDQTSGIINCPINKKNLKKKQSGVTEYLASKCSIKNNSEVMMIYNNTLSVIPLTNHLNLKKVSSKINKKLIITKIKTINKYYMKFLNKNPNIAILGINPHNGELEKNSEEAKIIIPAIKKLKKEGIKLDGPRVADTIFINDYKKYDVIVGMYHDQVLAPFKALFKFDAVNITLGLNHIRVSPDHGLALNLIKKKKSNPKSLLKCFEIIKKFENEFSKKITRSKFFN